MKEELQRSLQKVVQEIYGIEILPNIEAPRDPSHGDFASNVAMIVAGQKRKSGENINPLEIANKIAEVVNQTGEFTAEAAAPGFINFKFAKDFYNQYVREILENEQDFGKSNLEKVNIIVEFSSPNIAKPFTVGHLRSTVIGDSIARIYEFLGHTVFRDNHIGDWGASFGKYLAAFELYNTDLEALRNDADAPKKLVDIYVQFNKDIESNTELKVAAGEWFKKLEDGDETAIERWKICIEISFKEFNKIYRELDVTFTENDGRGYGESYFEEEMKLVLKDLEQANAEGKLVYKQSEGAMMVFFPKELKMPPLMILKSNGTTLYSTRDLATDRFRKNRPEYGHPNLIVLNETGNEQKLYWNQIFEIEKELGWYVEGQRVAITHGLYKHNEGQKISTREGNVVWLEEVLNKAEEKALEIAKQSESLTETEIKDVAKIIGYGAIKWNDLRRDSKFDIVFDWDEMLNLKGDSGPYVQYTYARAKSILRQFEGQLESTSPAPNTLIAEEEIAVSKELSKFPEVVERAAKDYSPNYIANYLFELATVFNKFYAVHSVIKAESEEDKTSRLLLTKATSIVLQQGLNLLGIQTVEKM